MILGIFPTTGSLETVVGYQLIQYSSYGRWTESEQDFGFFSGNTVLVVEMGYKLVFLWREGAGRRCAICLGVYLRQADLKRIGRYVDFGLGGIFFVGGADLCDASSVGFNQFQAVEDFCEFFVATGRYSHEDVVFVDARKQSADRCDFYPIAVNTDKAAGAEGIVAVDDTI